jgi:hypothetical protein
MHHVQGFEPLQGRCQLKPCRPDAQDPRALQRRHGRVSAISRDLALECRVQVVSVDGLRAVEELPQYETFRLDIQTRIIYTHSEAFTVSL